MMEYQKFVVTVDKQVVEEIQKTSAVNCYPMDTEARDMIDFFNHEIDNYSHPNASPLIKDAIEYFVTENYHEVYSKYLEWKENKNKYSVWGE